MDREMLSLGLALVLLILILGIVLFVLQFVAQYFTCLHLDQEGYRVNYEFPNCKVKVRQQDGSNKWMNYRYIGDDYILENFAVKREK